MASDKEIVSTLNDLVETCRDGEAGFHDCAVHIADEHLRVMFEDHARSCAVAAEQLEVLARQYGASPEDTGLTGRLHRRWVDLKSAAAGHDEVAILNQCERGEDIALHSYESALEHDLPGDIRSLVEQQYEGVKRNHDEVKRLRDQARAHH